MLEPMMMTLAVILGCLFLGLIMQVIHAQAIHKSEQRINEKLDQLLDQKIEYHGPNLEDLIERDFKEQMGFDPQLFTPATDEELAEILRDTVSQDGKQIL